MNLKKIFPFGFIVCCLLGHTIAMDDYPSNKEPRRTFQRPTIEQIKNHAKELKKSQPLHINALILFKLTIEGIIFEAQIDPWDQPSIVPKALRIKENGDTRWIEDNKGYLKEILFYYHSDNDGIITLRVNNIPTAKQVSDYWFLRQLFPQETVDKCNAFECRSNNTVIIRLPDNAEPIKIYEGGDKTRYKTFNDPNLEFIILG